MSFDQPDDPLAFTTADSLRANAAATLRRVCGEGPRGMPTTEVTTQHFFDPGGARRARAVARPTRGVRAE